MTVTTVAKITSSKHNSASEDVVTTFVALGSNLDDPDGQLRRAIFELAELPESRLLACSSFFISRPLGTAIQPDYINAVAKIETRLSAEALLKELQNIEDAHGRKRTIQWGARTLDLDLLLYGDNIISTDSLQVPHPEMQRRNFVLYPLLELVQDVEIPGVGWLREILQECSADGLKKYEPA